MGEMIVRLLEAKVREPRYTSFVPLFNYIINRTRSYYAVLDTPLFY